MESMLISMRKVVLVVLLALFCLMPLGCATSQLGETAAEGSRRHDRNLRLQRHQLTTDIDDILLLSEPSRLSEMRIP